MVASDETTTQRIIIENQLEQSNHDHLGKIVTYASGLDAKVIVWIVKEAREEHRSAIEWLNNNTNKDVNFFLIEIHAYKIGDSLYAPKFEIVEKPNDFIKTGKIQASSGEMNKSQSERLAFWTRFNEVIIERGRPFNVRKENINTLEASGELLLTIMASLAQQESASLSQNVKLGLQFRYQEGKVQINHEHFPGYTKDEEGNLIIDEEEAKVVRRIYREYLEGASFRDIAEGLERDRIKTGGKRYKWHFSTVPESFEMRNTWAMPFYRKL